MEAQEKKRTPFLAAAVWGLAAAGVALGCKNLPEGISRLSALPDAARTAVQLALLLGIALSGLSAIGQPVSLLLLLGSALLTGQAILHTKLPAAFAVQLLLLLGSVDLSMGAVRLSSALLGRLFGRERPFPRRFLLRLVFWIAAVGVALCCETL